MGQNQNPQEPNPQVGSNTASLRPPASGTPSIATPTASVPPTPPPPPPSNTAQGAAVITHTGEDELRDAIYHAQHPEAPENH